MSDRNANWPDLNQRALLTAVAEVRAALEAHVARAEGAPPSPPPRAGGFGGDTFCS
jgi:hypothetical protein